MWFEDLMDDCKQALELVWSNPKIALPYILHTLAVGIITAGLVFVFVFTFIVGVIAINSADFNFLGMLIPFLIAIPVLGIVFSALTALVDSGSLYIFAELAEGHQPETAMFWAGARRHFLSMWGIRVFLGTMVLILSPILAILVIPFSLTVGILSAGWGLIVVPVLASVFFSAWPMALILDDQGGFKALGAGIRLGRNYFWGMFVLGLATLLIGQQMSSAFGPLVAIIIGWVIAVFVGSWLKMALLLIYKRRK